MEKADAYSILSESIQVILLAGAPVLIGALAIGLFIAVFQALTQIQEMTLTFVPKIIGIFLILLVSLPYMYSQIEGLALKVFDLIVVGGF